MTAASSQMARTLDSIKEQKLASENEASQLQKRIHSRFHAFHISLHDHSFFGAGFALDEFPVDIGNSMISLTLHFCLASSSFSNSRWINSYFLIAAKYKKKKKNQLTISNI